MSNQVLLGKLKNEIDEVSIKCWLQISEKDKYTYLFQVESTSKRDLNKVLGVLDGCVTANGFDPRKGSAIVITKKVFKTRKEFEFFRATCPLNIELT